MDKCIICDIVERKQDSYIIYEDDNFISFLDIRPLFIGHSLLAPKKHIQTLYDFPANEGKSLISVTQKIGNAITTAMQSEGTFIAMNNIVSQSINHMHVHIVPRNKKDGLKGFFWPRTQYESNEHMVKIQIAIKNAMIA